MLTFNDKKAICKKLGYHDLKPCMEKLDYLEKNGIEIFLKANFKYDFVLPSELFLKKVIELCGNKKDMQIFEKTKEKVSRKPGYLFVNTNFKRNSEPIFVLAMMESLRNIKIDRKKFESKDEELEFVKNFVRKHYKENNGELKIWRKIQNYIYKSESFDKYLVIDKDGHVIKEMDEFNPSCATLVV